MIDALNKLCKWRTVLAGWHIGTKSMTEPGTKAMRDLMDKWLVLRSETTALITLLIEQKVISAEDFSNQVRIEAAFLDEAMEKMFPGFKSFDGGIHITDVGLAEQTMQRLGFPP